MHYSYAVHTRSRLAHASFTRRASVSLVAASAALAREQSANSCKHELRAAGSPASALNQRRFTACCFARA